MTPPMGEPDWDDAPTSPTLTDTHLLSIVLCKFAGHKLGLDEHCEQRGVLHPDVRCQALFFAADGLNEIVVGHFLDRPEVRAPYALNEAADV